MDTWVAPKIWEPRDQDSPGSLCGQNEECFVQIDRMYEREEILKCHYVFYILLLKQRCIFKQDVIFFVVQSKNSKRY